MSGDTIAAVIPLYNKQRFITRAIASVLSQSRPVDEIIVVDDASTDGSLDRIKAFADPRLKVLHRAEPGAGGYAARNLAIRSASSRWIAFLDADDTWKSDFVEEISRLISEAPETTGCLFTGHEKVWSNGRIVRDIYSLRHASAAVRPSSFEGFLSDWVNLGSAPIWTSACTIRRDVLLAAGLFPEGRCRRGGDKDTWLRTMMHTNALSSPRPLATYYTVTENQVTRQETFNTRPCLLATVEGLLRDATGKRRTLLKRLYNLEVFDYALMVGPRERVSAEVYRGFFVTTNPARYVALLALTYLPAPVANLLRTLILRGRSLTRRLRTARAALIPPHQPIARRSRPANSDQ
jgi:succinoglycan biosynthesis protein ExoO